MKKLIAFVLTATLLVTGFVLPSFALYDNDDENLICKDTVDVSFHDDEIVVYVMQSEFPEYKKGMTWSIDMFGEGLPIQSISEHSFNLYAGTIWLSIKLSVHDKQVVLDTIKEIEKCDFVYLAKPNYIVGDPNSGCYQTEEDIAHHRAFLESLDDDVYQEWLSRELEAAKPYLSRPSGYVGPKKDDENGGTKIGDVDNDNNVTAADALNILQYSIGKAQFTEKQCTTADINVDTFVNSADSLLALRESIK